jgi:His-Xaa-Ser system radical SAM maturase HxsC
VLSNGRRFRHLRFAKELAAIGHPDLMLGVPLYADTAAHHDFVVQARGAFNETMLGYLNLGRVGLRAEVRVVVHALTFKRLPQLARFIGRNLPFVEQVVLMGLELTGFARTNVEALWVDPFDYSQELDEAVAILDDAGLDVSIYNHPLCLLPRSLWKFARQSISDWKNVFVDECDRCSVRAECSGFFQSSNLRMSTHVEPQCGGFPQRAVSGEDVRQPCRP